MTELYLPNPVPKHLSHSQASNIRECGERYRLERIFKIPVQPAVWFPAGSAFHRASEIWDYWSMGLPNGGCYGPDGEIVSPLSDLEGRADSIETPAAKRDYSPDEYAAYDTEASIEALWQDTLMYYIRRDADAAEPQWKDPASWRASGRGKEDLTWWQANGGALLLAYIKWRESSGWTIALIDDMTPAIEFDVTCSIIAPDGEQIQVVGAIDRVYLNPQQIPVIGDLKTGQEPKSHDQLGEYAVFLGVLGLPQPSHGAYYLAKKHQMSVLHPLTHFTESQVAWTWQKLKRDRDAGDLVANPDSPWCGACQFRSYCYAVAGSKAHLIPAPWTPEGKPPVAAEALTADLGVS